MKIPLIVILGPTASGKTSLAINLARKFHGEIICADSRTVYNKLDIGTAKPSAEEQKAVPHHLLDLVEPGQQFNVAEYQKLAQEKIAEIWSRGKIPFLVGGSGLYIDAVIYGYEIPRVAPDRKFRQNLEKKSKERLFEELNEKDPEFASGVDKNNKRRLIRALEVIAKTGQKFSALKKKKPPKYDLIILGIKLEREELYKKIDARVHSRIKDGMVEEVRNLVEKEKVDLEWLDNLGLEYRYLSRYILGRTTRQDAIQELIFAIHCFARRQITWFRRNKKIHWIKNEKEAEKLIGEFVKKKT